MQPTKKQKVKAYYDALEKQVTRYYRATEKSKGKTGDALLRKLEYRLDNMVYRIEFANSIRLVHQQVTHDHILADGKRPSIPSYAVQPGDVIALRERSGSNELLRTNSLDGKGLAIPYLECDFNALSSTLTRLPNREEVPMEVNGQLVVKYYSR